MTNVPFKWGKVNNEGKVGINVDSETTFTSDSGALTVNGNVVADNIAAMASDMSSQATQMSSLEGRVTTLENAVPSLSGGIVKATTPMSIASGLPSDLESGTGKFYSNGFALPNSSSPIKAVWFKANDANPGAEIGMGDSSGVLYLRQYDSNNTVTKEAALLDENGNTTFPGTVAATTFSGALNGTASNAAAVSNMTVASGRNNAANQIMRTDSNGKAQFGIIDTQAADLSAAVMSKIFCSDNDEIKYKTIPNFIAGLGLNDALKESNFLGYKIKFVSINVGTVDITSSWGNAYEGHKEITFSNYGINLGLNSVIGAWVSAWSTDGNGWEMYPSIFTISPTKADIYFIRGTSKSVPNVIVNLLILGS